jgi:hypothetical protein
MSDKDIDLDNTFELMPNDLASPEEWRTKAERPGGEGASATANLALDPITGRPICDDCWNCRHGTRGKSGCKVHTCRCWCKDGRKEHRRERSAHAVARREGIGSQGCRSI